MPLSPSEARQALRIVTSAAVADALSYTPRGGPGTRRAAYLAVVPDLIGYYSIGSAALAADYYDDLRADASPRTRYVAGPVVADRAVKIRRSIAWAADPDNESLESTVQSRLAQVVQYETARPYRDTIIENRRRDPAAVGWRRVTGPESCKLCQMLADRGAVYRAATARFAAHDNCGCAAVPIFHDGAGPEATALQYVASKRNRTARQRAELRNFLNSHYPDTHG